MGEDADGDDGTAQRLVRHTRLDKRTLGGASASDPSKSVVTAEWTVGATDASSAADSEVDWPALFEAALAEGRDDSDSDRALPALSALSAAMSRMSSSTAPTAANVSTGSPTPSTSSGASQTGSPRSRLLSVWPFLPTLYSRLTVKPDSPRHVAVVCEVLLCVLSVSVSFPSSVLLARSDPYSVDSGPVLPSEPLLSRHVCLWSVLSDAVEARLSDLTAASSSLSCSVLCQLLRCCAELLPSTLSVLSVYGDVVGCVLPAVLRVTDRTRQLLLDPTAPPLLTQYAAGLVRCVLLTHTPIQVVDGLDPLLPASLSAQSSSSSSSSSSRSTVSSPSSSSLSSFPVLSSECALYFSTVSAFDLRLLTDSHPDLNAQHLHDIASSLMHQLTDSVRQCVTVTPSVCVHLELLLFVVRQRSIAYGSLCLPALLRVASQLSSLPASALASSALQTIRLGLFSLFRLSSCAPYWSAMLAVLSQPATSIVAMEVQRINKQRSSSHTQRNDVRNQPQQPAHFQRPQLESLGASFGQSAVVAQHPVLNDVVREVVDIESAALQPLLSSAFSLPLPLICDLILRSLYALPLSSSGQPHGVHGQQQQALIQVQAAIKQMHWKGADMAHTAADADRKPPSATATLPPSADPSPSSFTAPLLNTQPLSDSAQSSISRLCFVRLLSTTVDLTASHRTMTALRAALLPSITVAGRAGTVEHTVEVTDSELVTHWVAEHQYSADQQHEELEYDEDDADEDEADGGVSTRSLLASLRLSSSLTSSAEYSALLSYILSDVIERYELLITFAYKLARLAPHAIHVTVTQGDSEQQDTDQHEQTTQQQRPREPPEHNDNDQPAQPASDQQLNGDTAQPVVSGSDTQRGKRQLVAADTTPMELGSHKQQRTAYSSSDTTHAESVETAIARVDEWVERHQPVQLSGQAASEQQSLEDVPYATDPLSLPVVSPPVENDSGGVVRSARFLSVLSSFFRSHGGVEYQQLVEGVVTALDSALFSSATTAGATHTVRSPACGALLQLLLDLPLLPPSVWSCIDRYLASSSSSSVGLLAVRVLIEQRPPASDRAIRLLLRHATMGSSESVRQHCVELAVDCIATPAAPAQLRARVVQRALTLAAFVSDPEFLAQLPTITVSIVVPPPPLYEDIQLPSVAGQSTSESSVAGGSVDASAATSVDSFISSLLSAVVGGYSAQSDGSDELDEARRRSIQQLIADGARRKKEFDKLVLRRQLLVKEKELRERQASERQQQRKQTTHTHLGLLFALIQSSPRIAFDASKDETRQLYERVWSVYALTSSAEPARKLIHSFLPAMVLSVGPTLSLLTSLQAQPAACDPCVLHVLQLLCSAPPASDDSHLTPQLAALSAGAREHSLVHPTSPVAVVCWYLFHIRRGDARFIIPLLPMLRADQLRRCLHRIVALPTVHIKVALHRMLRPHVSLAAKGNRLTQPHPQPLSPAELVIALHRLDQHRRAALPTNSQPRPSSDSDTEAASPPVSLPLPSPLPASADLSVCPASSASSNYPSDDGTWLRSLISAVQLCFAAVDLFPASTLASVISALRVDRPLSRLFLRTCIQCVQLQPSLTSFVLSVVHSLVRSERSMVAVSLLWEGVLKLASLSLPHSLDLLLDLPDEGVARLFGSLSAPQLLAALQAADNAVADTAADKMAGRKPVKPVKQTPLQMCQVAVARAVLQQPQRVRHVYRKYATPAESQPYQHPLPVTHPLQPLHAPPTISDSTIQHVPPPPAAAATTHFASPPAFGDRSGWSSSHPRTQLAGPAPPLSHSPSILHPAAATAAGGVAGSVAAGVAGLPSSLHSYNTPFPARQPPLTGNPAGPSTAHASFAAAMPPFHYPFTAHQPSTSHPSRGVPPFQLHSGPVPSPASLAHSATGGGWKSVRIPAAQPAHSSSTTASSSSRAPQQQSGRGQK